MCPPYFLHRFVGRIFFSYFGRYFFLLLDPISKSFECLFSLSTSFSCINRFIFLCIFPSDFFCLLSQLVNFSS